VAVARQQGEQERKAGRHHHKHKLVTPSTWSDPEDHWGSRLVLGVGTPRPEELDYEYGQTVRDDDREEGVPQAGRPYSMHTLVTPSTWSDPKDHWGSRLVHEAGTPRADELGHEQGRDAQDEDRVEGASHGHTALHEDTLQDSNPHQDCRTYATGISLSASRPETSAFSSPCSAGRFFDLLSSRSACKATAGSSGTKAGP
jgi:hypothetical protein